MLSPKRVKHRKVMRGRMKGKASRGNFVSSGEYGLQALEPHWITANQIEAARIAMTRYIKRGGQVWIKVFPDKPVTKKPADPMGFIKPEYVIAELLRAPENKRSSMIGLIGEYDIVVLELSEEIERLARIYVQAGIIPEKFMADGLHIAATTVNDLDMILSLNFKHIVKKKTMELASFVNIREGYRSIGIFTPMEVVEE